MGGGLIQLVAYGAQDIYLTGNPEITFFKVVYRRHTNFAVEAMEIPIDSAKFDGENNTQILRNGDLVSKIWLRVVLPDITGANVTYNTDSILNGKIAWVRRLGYAIIRTIKIDIGGTEMDKHLGIWMNIWYELTHTLEQERGFNEKLGDVSAMTQLTGNTTVTPTTIIIRGRQLYIPLQFWFCRNYGLALPLIALQYHEVRIRTAFTELTKLICWSGVTQPNMNSYQISNASYLVDYIFLDTTERRRFAQVGHEYLIEQVQFTSEETISGSYTDTIAEQYKLTFNHPCKEIIWGLTVGAYNGETDIDSLSFIRSRGRFLAYSNTDDWTDALDYSALNLVSNMLMNQQWYGAAYLTTVTGAVSLDIGITTTIHGGETISVVLIIPSGTGHNITANITIMNSTAGDYVSSIAGLRYVGWSYQNLFIKNGVNLVDSIDTISFDITLSKDVLTHWVYLINNIVIDEHDMEMYNISIPVDDWTDKRVWVDTRFTNPYIVGGLNGWDISLIEFTNFGLQLDGMGNPVLNGKIKLNGYDRFTQRDGTYFNYIQTEAHTRTPADGINVYSFSLYPEQHQPSGTANLSRIDTTELILNFSDPYRTNIDGVPSFDYVTNSKLFIFAFSYNVLRIMSGLAGLAYNN